MNHDDRKKLFAALSAAFPEEAIERTNGRQTGRGYNTTGVKYQYIANRLNEVLGVGGYRTSQTTSVRETTTTKGRPAFEATCELTLQLGEWTSGEFMPFAEAHGTGGHTSTNEADARKGAFTNGFKKAAAMLGCGKQAYEGTLDDDNVAGLTPASGANLPSSGGEAARGDGGQPTRNRLTSRQLAALWAMARKLDIEKGAFRNRVRERFGVNVEFLDRQAASKLIGELSLRLSNGAAHDHAADGG